MYRFLCVIALVLLSVASVARAYDVSVETVPEQYEVIQLSGDPEHKQTILGELSNAPEMYEVKSDHDFTLTVEIRAVPGDLARPQFSGIIVRQKEQLGVEEVARMKAIDAAWTSISDGTTGLVYQAGPFFSEKVKAGTYHIEVSTPDNSGKYMLVVGNTDESAGYIDTLHAIGVVYDFYGLGTFAMYHSPYIYYPVGIVVVILLIIGTWYWQRRNRIHA
jgi:hypothetical protein